MIHMQGPAFYWSEKVEKAKRIIDQVMHTGKIGPVDFAQLEQLLYAAHEDVKRWRSRSGGADAHNAHTYDPNELMELLTTEDLIEVVWAVIEGGDPLATALDLAEERERQVHS